MAIYHCTVKIIGRSAGRSSVGAAAYRAGEKIYNRYDGMIHNYQKKQGIVHKEMMLPQHAPLRFRNRAVLWNAVELAERRKDAQTSREVVVALPVELERDRQIEVVREYVKRNFVDKGMCADVCLHDKMDGNPHAHIMLTTRLVSREGFGGKCREWNDKARLEAWRESWAKVCNRALEGMGVEERIDHRSYEARGIDKEATIHLGPAASRLEKRGIRTRPGDVNRAIIQRNHAYAQELGRLLGIRRQLLQEVDGVKPSVVQRLGKEQSGTQAKIGQKENRPVSSEGKRSVLAAIKQRQGVDGIAKSRERESMEQTKIDPVGKGKDRRKNPHINAKE